MSSRRSCPAIGTPVNRQPVPGLDATVCRFLTEIWGNRCYYCGKAGGNLQREHRIPLARVGDNHISNIVAACGPCNRAKGILTDDEYFKSLAGSYAYGAGPSPLPRGACFANHSRTVFRRPSSPLGLARRNAIVSVRQVDGSGWLHRHRWRASRNGWWHSPSLKVSGGRPDIGRPSQSWPTEAVPAEWRLTYRGPDTAPRSRH